MITGVALALFGLGVAVWPVLTAAERRLDRLRRIARVAPDRLLPVARPVGRVDRGRAVAVGATALAVLRGELDAGAPFAAALVTARDRAGTAVAAFDLGAGIGGGAGGDAGGGGPGRSGAGRSGAGLLAPAEPASRRFDVLAHARRCLTTGAGLVAVTGAPWSAVAAGIGRDVAAHDAREREIASALAGARASTVVLGGLPVLGLGLAVALGADPVAFLLHTPAGRWVLAAGATLDLLGVVVSTVVAARAAR